MLLMMMMMMMMMIIIIIITPCGRDFVEELLDPQADKKSLLLYGNRSFIRVFTTARCNPCPGHINAIYALSSYFLKIYFNVVQNEVIKQSKYKRREEQWKSSFGEQVYGNNYMEE